MEHENGKDDRAAAAITLYVDRFSEYDFYRKTGFAEETVKGEEYRKISKMLRASPSL